MKSFVLAALAVSFCVGFQSASNAKLQEIAMTKCSRDSNVNEDGCDPACTDEETAEESKSQTSAAPQEVSKPSKVEESNHQTTAMPQEVSKPRKGAARAVVEGN